MTWWFCDLLLVSLHVAVLWNVQRSVMWWPSNLMLARPDEWNSCHGSSLFTVGDTRCDVTALHGGGGWRSTDVDLSSRLERPSEGFRVAEWSWPINTSYLIFAAGVAISIRGSSRAWTNDDVIAESFLGSWGSGTHSESDVKVWILLKVRKHLPNSCNCFRVIR